MSKGSRRRPIQVDTEEYDLQWDLIFACTEEAKHQAQLALDEYYAKIKLNADVM